MHRAGDRECARSRGRKREDDGAAKGGGHGVVTRAAERSLQALGEHHVDLVGRAVRRVDIDLDALDGLVTRTMEGALEDHVRGLSLGKAGTDDLESVADLGLAWREVEHVEELGRGLRRHAAARNDRENEEAENEGEKPRSHTGSAYRPGSGEG